MHGNSNIKLAMILVSSWTSGCSAVSDRWRSTRFTTPRQWCTSDSKQVTQVTRLEVAKTIKYHFAFCAAEDAEEKETFDSILNLKYFIQALKFRWPTQKLLWPPNFQSFSCGPLQNLCGPLEDHMAHVEKGWYEFNWLQARPKNARIRRRKYILFI